MMVADGIWMGLHASEDMAADLARLAAACKQASELSIALYGGEWSARVHAPTLGTCRSSVGDPSRGRVVTA
jgi:hypothetical protein